MKEIEILARALIPDGDHILLVRSSGGDYTFLPGGHVEWGEAAPHALTRELREELGIACEVGAYLGAVEHAWRDASGKHHEINHCFLASCRGLAHTRNPESVEPQLEFLWAQAKDLDWCNLMPLPLRALIRALLGGERGAWWGSTL